MAYFKEVTLMGGEKITINLDQVHVMRWFGKSTAIYFAKTTYMTSKRRQLRSWPTRSMVVCRAFKLRPLGSECYLGGRSSPFSHPIAFSDLIGSGRSQSTHRKRFALPSDGCAAPHWEHLGWSACPIAKIRRGNK